LNGCLAPVVRSSVIINVGPVLSSFGRGIGWSEDGPMAVEKARFVLISRGSECDWAGFAVGRGGTAGLLDDLEERVLISTGVEETGSGESVLLVFVIS
jgi:hypothetical protein